MRRHPRNYASARRNGLRRLSLERLEDRCLPTTVAEFPIRPVGGTPTSFGIASGGPDGKIWFTAENSTANGNQANDQYDEIGVMTPTGSTQQVAVPTLDAGIGAITLGPDNNYWFLESTANAIGVINAQTHAIAQYPLLSTANAGLADITSGPDNTVWFTETNANKVGEFNVNTHVFTEFPLPTSLAEPEGITWDPTNSLIWFTEEGAAQIGSIDPTTHAIAEYPIAPTGSNYEPLAITADANGNLWFTDLGTSQVQMFNLTSTSFGTPISLPTDHEPGDIATGPNGTIWLTEVYSPYPTEDSELGMITISNGQLTNYSDGNFDYDGLGALTAGPDGRIWVGSNTQSALYAFKQSTETGTQYTYQDVQLVEPPTEATFGPDGNLWYALPGSSNLGDTLSAVAMTNLATNVTTFYDMPTPGGLPVDVAVGPDGNIWFTETGTGSTGKVGVINPSTGAISDYALPSSDAVPYGITGDPTYGNLWFTEYNLNQIGRIMPASKAINDSIKLPTGDSGPDFIVADSSGNLWVSMKGSGTVDEFDPQGAGSWLAAPISFGSGVTPEGMVFDANGNLWVALYSESAPSIVEIDPQTDAILQKVAVPNAEGNIALGPDNNIWFTETSGIGMVNPSTGTVTSTNLSNSYPNAVAGGYTSESNGAYNGDGNVWFTSAGEPSYLFGSNGYPNVLGEVVLTANQTAANLAVTVQPPPDVTAGRGFGLVVAVENASGGVVTTDDGATVTLALANDPASTTLNGTLTATVENGYAVFSGLSIPAAGSNYTIKATSGSLTSATTSAFDVSLQATHLVVTTEPPASVSVGSGFEVAIAAEDVNGHVDTSFTGSVTVTINNNPGDGTLGGTVVLGATGGVADFTGLTISEPGTDYTLTAAADGLTSTGTSGFNVNPAPATQLVITTEPPGSVVAGAGFGLTVQAQDAAGALDTSYNGPVTIALASNPGSATLGGTLTVNAVNGVATFTGLTLNVADTGYTLTVTSGTLTAATTSAIAVTAAPASQLAIKTEPPSSVASGSAFNLVVQAEDTSGNVVTTFSGNVTIALGSNLHGGTLGGTLTVAAVNGVANFNNLTLDKAGSGYTLSATANGLTATASSAIAVTPGAAAQLAVTAEPPSSVTAGSSFGLTVSVEDAAGNVVTGFSGSVTIALGANPGSATLGGTLTLNASAGVATFSGLTLDKADSGYTIKASSNGLTSASSSTITVTAGTATQLAITGEPPASVSVGSAFSLTVTVEDAEGNVATGFNGSITIALGTNPAGATLGGTLTVNANAGVATFSGLTLDKSGSGYTLVATANGLTAATTNTFDVQAAAATQLVISTQPPASVTAGAAFSVVVQAEDADGNVDTSFHGTVTIALAANGSGATLGGTVTVNAVNGVATFTGLTLDKVGSGFTLTVASNGLTSATTSAISVTAGAGTQLVITSEAPTSVSAGSAFSITVTVEDADGNVAADFNGSITIALGTNPGGATLGGTLTVNATAGIATFDGLTLNIAGSGFTLVVSANGLTSATTGTISITAGAATQLVLTTQPPASVAAGAGFTVVVQIEDADGNLGTSFNGTVTIALGANGDGATLGGTLTVTAVNGVATFTGLTLDKVGTGFTLVVSSSGLTSAASGTIAITAGAATQLVLTTQPPASVAAGAAFTVVVQVEDADGNLDTGFSGTVTIALGANGNGATLGGTLTVDAVDGVATFSDLALDAVGSGFTLVVSANGLTSATTGTIAVSAGAATQLVLTTQPPTSVTAGAGFSVVVQAEDADGNIDTGFNGTVAIALGANGNGATLGGTLTVNAVNGVATFSGLTLDKVGSGFTLVVSSNGLTAATTSAIAVTAGTATQLVITSEPPSGVAVGSAISLTVTVEDADGNAATGFNGSISVVLGTNPGGATLGGTTSVNATAGVATFAGLTLNKPGSGFTLVASSNGLTSATTSAIAVNAGAATQLVLTTMPPASVSAGAAFSVVVQAEDADGNIDTGFNGTVTVALGANGNGATLGGTLTVNAVNGVATFTGLTLDKVGSGFTLVVSSNGLTAATTSAIAVMAGTATQLAITGEPPSGVGAGSAFGLTVTVEDADGNVATGFNGSITIALGTNPDGATLGGTLTVNATAGVAAFSGLTLDKAGNGYILVATANGVTAATSSAFGVQAAAATQLVLTTQPPASVAAGAAFSVVVQAQDADGNIDTSFNGTVTIALGANGSGATLGGTLTVTAVNGVATFNGLTLDKVGTGFTLVISSNGLIPATTSAIAVTPGAAIQLAITSEPPTSVAAGSPFSLTVAVEDADGNVATGFNGSISIALGTNPGGATLGGTLTVAANAGVASFDGLSLNQEGAGYTLAASSSGLFGAATRAMTVTPAQTTQLVVTLEPPASLTTGASFGLTVSAESKAGAIDPSFNGAVTLALGSNPGNATLGGPLTATASAGVAVFSGLTLSAPGSGYTLVATANGLTPVTSTAIDVSAVATSPNAPQLASSSDTGVSQTDRITRDNGSAQAPLTFTVGGVSPANGFVQLEDLTNPSNPMLLGAPVQAVDGSATITLSGTPLADGTHAIAATTAAVAGGAASAASATTAVVIQTSLRVTGISPSANFLTSLPNNQVVVSFNHPLAGLVADQSNGSGFATAPFAVMLVPSGPDGLATQQRTGSLWSAPSGYDSGDLPLPATAVYHVNADGTSTITLRPKQPLATDVYLIEISAVSDLAGNPVANAQGVVGSVYASFDYRPATNLSALHVTAVTTDNGATPVGNNTIPQPDTIGIRFNKPLDTDTVNTSTIQLLAKQGATYTPVASAVTYSPTTDSAYLTPEAALQPGTLYIVAVGTGVTDDQGFPNPGVPLGQPYYASFMVSRPGVVAGTGALAVTGTNPVNGTLWSSALGYGAITFNEPITLSSLGRFSAMLIPQTGGVTTGGSGYADVPVNAKLAFNPNTNQLIVVPTGMLADNVVYLLSVSGVTASNGNRLASTHYATFKLHYTTAAPAVMRAASLDAPITAPSAVPSLAPAVHLAAPAGASGASHRVRHEGLTFRPRVRIATAVQPASAPAGPLSQSSRFGRRP